MFGVMLGGETMPTNQEVYTVLTYDVKSSNAMLYLNGVLAGTASIPTNLAPANYGNTFNNWIGRDQFGGDSMFQGSVDELRIWNGAVSPLYIALSQLAGPDTVITNLTPLSVTVMATNTSIVGAETEQASVTANFAQFSGVDVTAAVTNWSSSNPKILTVTSSGLITGLSGGTASVSATIGGITGTSAVITVALTKPTITQEPVSATNFVGETAFFSIQALGGQLSYQWSEGGTPIPGATNSTLTFPNVVLGNAGSYSVVVSNPLGSTNSAVVSLTVEAPSLVHRWSFNEAAGDTNAADSVGGADGVLMGDAAFDGNGNVTFPNEGATSGSGSPPYVSLPNGVLTNLNSLTVECWATDSGGLTWAEIYCFGDSTAGPGFANAGTNYISFIPHSGPGDMRAAFKLQNEEDVIWPGTTMPMNVEEYITLTYDAPSTTAILYLNGGQVGINTNVNITPNELGNTFNNWIGRDEWGGDPCFVGSVDELRIWNAPVSPLYQELTIQAGPNVLITNTTPSLVTVTATNTTLVGGQTEFLTVTGNFAQLANVTLPPSLVTWTSSDTNILTVNSSGLVTSFANGTATISATAGGVTVYSSTITVKQVQPTVTQAPAALSLSPGQTAVFSVGAAGGTLTYQWSQGTTAISGATNSTLTLPDITAQDAGTYSVLIANSIGTTNVSANLVVTEPGLTHRWSFNDPAGSATDLDSVGGADGTNMGNAFIDVTNGTVVLPDTTTTSTTPGASYVMLPPGILTDLNSATIEVWATDNGPRTWAEIYSFGGSTSGFNDIDNQTNYIGFIPTSGPGDMRAAFKLLSEEDVIYPFTPMPTNVEEDVALTYDNTTTTAILYLNTKAVAINTNITITPADLGITYNNYLGRDQFEDSIFHGSIDELRIYAGPLTPTDILNNHTGGPNKLVAPGTANQTAITIALSGKNVVLTWPQGSLLQATSLLGPWTSNTTAVSPYTVPATNTAQFFKFVAP